MRCYKCARPATVHISETRQGGDVLDTHLCVACATAAGYPHVPRVDYRELLRKSADLIRETEDFLGRTGDDPPK
jgi:protein-arginine kinase activator protein McsA